MAAMFFVHGAMLGIWATQIPLIKERLGLDTASLGWALIASALGGVVAMQFATTLSARLTPKALVRSMIVLGCLMLPMAVAATNGVMLAAFLFLFGAGLGLVDLVMNEQAVRVEGLRGRPIMSGLHGMWSLGGLSGAGGGSLLLALVSPLWQAGLLAFLGVALVLAVSGWMLPGADAGDRRRAPRVKGLMWRGPLLLTGAMMAMAFSIEGAILDWSAIFLRETRHLPESEAGLGYAAFAGSMLLGRLTGDRARARWGDRRMLQGPILGGFLMAAAVLVPNPWFAIAGFAGSAIMLCNVAPILFNVAGRLGAQAGAATQAVAATVSVGYAGVVGAPPLLGFVARQTSLSLALCIAAASCVVMGLCARALPTGD